jgi:hypothetical protein
MLILTNIMAVLFDNYISVSDVGITFNGSVSVLGIVNLPTTTILENASLLSKLANKVDTSMVYLKTATDTLLNEKLSLNNPVFSGDVSLPSTTTLNNSVLTELLAAKAPLANPVFTGVATFPGNVATPKFKAYSVANNLSASAVFNSVGWLIANNHVFNGGTCLVNISASGWIQGGRSVDNVTWTLQYSTNNQASYITIGSMTKYINVLNCHNQATGSFIWKPGSVTVTHFRVLFSSQLDGNDFLYLTIIQFPF